MSIEWNGPGRLSEEQVYQHLPLVRFKRLIPGMIIGALLWGFIALIVYKVFVRIGAFR